MATLIINRSESYCAACPQGERGAFPSEDGHFTQAGWTKHGEPGCGRKWTAVSSDYVGGSFDRIEDHYFGFENLRGLPVIRVIERHAG